MLEQLGPVVYFRHDVLLKEQLAARGFVSDVTVKRREEALLVSKTVFRAASIK